MANQPLNVIKTGHPGREHIGLKKLFNSGSSVIDFAVESS
jgi:hypothetical protein